MKGRRCGWRTGPLPRREAAALLPRLYRGTPWFGVSGIDTPRRDGPRRSGTVAGPATVSISRRWQPDAARPQGDNHDPATHASLEAHFQATRPCASRRSRAARATGARRPISIAAPRRSHDHWWVQAQSGTAWRDWDVLTATGGAVADRRSDHRSRRAARQPLSTRLRSVSSMESWQGGASGRRRSLLEHTIRTGRCRSGPQSPLAFVADDFPKTFPYARLLGCGCAAQGRARSARVDAHPVRSASTHIIQNAITDTGGITMPTRPDRRARGRSRTRPTGSAPRSTKPSARQRAPAPPPACAGRLHT